MTIILFVIGLFATLVGLIFYYKHSNEILKNKDASNVIEKKAINYEKDAYKDREKIEQVNDNLPVDDVRKRVRDKGYARPKD